MYGDFLWKCVETEAQNKPTLSISELLLLPTRSWAVGFRPAIFPPEYYVLPKLWSGLPTHASVFSSLPGSRAFKESAQLLNCSSFVSSQTSHVRCRKTASPQLLGNVLVTEPLGKGTPVSVLYIEEKLCARRVQSSSQIKILRPPLPAFSPGVP